MLDTYHYSKSFEIRWADLDPNFHVLHSRYYDYGAFCRMSYFIENGLTPQLLQLHNIGPILFKEECTFRREINFGDKMLITLKMEHFTDNFSRWGISHTIYKNDILAAQLKVEGAWMDIIRRKLATPPAAIVEVFHRMMQNKSC